MHMFRTYFFRSFILLLVILLGACASLTSKASQRYMQEALESNKKGDTYEALTKAITAYQYDSDNEESKRFIKENHKNAFAQAVDLLNKRKLSANELPSFREELNNLSKAQDYLKEVKFINANIVDINEIKNNYETNLSKNLINEIDQALIKGQFEESKKLIAKYRDLELPKTPQLISTVSRLQQLFLAQGAFAEVIDFTKKNKDCLSSETFKETYSVLLKYAASDEAINKKRALETYLFLSELDNNNVLVMKKISDLRNKLITMFAVLDLENNTDEFIPVNNNDFIKIVKAIIDSRENLTEVILKDDGLNDIRDDSVNYDFFRKKDELKVRFENNIRYLIVSKIASIKINRQSPLIVTKNASWNIKSPLDAITIAQDEMEAYGIKAKVQYYQYDEYTEKVNARMVIDIIVYDVKQKRVVLKERLELLKEDAAKWAENPMAVGIMNKVPATVYPPEIRELRNKKRPLMTDNDIKKTLIEEMSAEIGKRSIGLLTSSDRSI